MGPKKCRTPAPSQKADSQVSEKPNSPEAKVDAPVEDNRELKQTDAAVVNRQISIQIQSDLCQGPTEFTWP